MNGTKIKLDISDKIIRTLGYILVTIYAIACVFPFLIILGTSFTSEAIVRVEGVQLIPKEFTTYAYELILKAGTIGGSYIVTILMTVCGTAVGLSIIAMTGYAAAEKMDSLTGMLFLSTFILQAFSRRDLHPITW